MLLAELVATSEDVAATSSRLAKRDRLAECLRAARRRTRRRSGSPYLTGEPRQRRTGVGYRGLGDAARAGRHADADAARRRRGAGRRSRRLAGPGSNAERAAARRRAVRSRDGPRAALPALADRRRATPGRARGRVDRGDREGRRRCRQPPCGARCCWPATSPGVGATALQGGLPALEAIRIEVGRPLAPMLAGSAPDAATRDRAARQRRRRVEARRHPRADPRARRRGRDLHAQPRRRHRSAARAGRDRARAAGALGRSWTARRSRSGPTIARCPFQVTASRAARRGGAGRALAARSSTACTSTATI